MLGLLCAAASCFLRNRPESTPEGLRCGGTCFKDGTCSGAPGAKACCPAGQFCWHKSTEDWFCRSNPVKGAGEPASQATCGLPQAEFVDPAAFPSFLDSVLTQTDYNAALQFIKKPHR